MTKKSKILFTIDESSEVYQNAINNIEKKYQNILNNSLKFHETNIINRLPYSVDDRLVIEFKEDTIIKGIDDFNLIYLLFFKSNTKYVFYYNSSLDAEYVLLIDNKVVYFIDDISKITNKEITNQSIKHSLIPCYIEETNLTYINFIDEKLLFDLPLLYNGAIPSLFNIEEISSSKYRDFENALLDKKSYNVFKNYIISEKYPCFSCLFNDNKYCILEFNDDYYCEFDNDVLYFEKGKKYIFIYYNNNKFIYTFGIPYNLFKFKNIIESLATKQKVIDKEYLHNINHNEDDICIPNLLINTSTSLVNILKDAEEVKCIKDNNSLIIFNHDNYILNFSIYNNKDINEVIRYVNNNITHEYGCIYKRILDIL